MGQRHQIYVFVKDEQGKVQGACIHHQWLYGRSACLKVINVMAYFKKAKGIKYHPFTGESFGRGLSACLLALYQIDMLSGDFNGSASAMNHLPTDTAEAECIANPRMGDNNDGITVFDFTNPLAPAYCMVNISEFKTNDKNDHSVRQLAPWVPHTIGEYVSAYYPKRKRDRMDEEDKAEFELIFRKTEQLTCMSQNDLAVLFPAVFNNEAVA